MPFFVVRYDSLIGSYLGETNTRLRKLFDYIRTQPCVLFFDEFDAIGKERGDTHETGEIKRVVSFLLMQLDQLPSYVIVVAATNHAELLDRAVWRRFQLRLGFPEPDPSMLAAYVERLISQWPEKPKVGAKGIVRILGKISYAEAREYCQNVRRRYILGLGEIQIDDAVRVESDLWASRIKPTESDAERSDQTTSAPDAQSKRRPPKRSKEVSTAS